MLTHQIRIDRLVNKARLQIILCLFDVLKVQGSKDYVASLWLESEEESSIKGGNLVLVPDLYTNSQLVLQLILLIGYQSIEQSLIKSLIPWMSVDILGFLMQ
jgi:hypothetical protein